MGRNSIGIEILNEYYSLVNEQLNQNQLELFESKSNYETNRNF